MVKRYSWFGDLIYADGSYADSDNPASLVDSADYDSLVAELDKCKADQADGIAWHCRDRDRVCALEAALRYWSGYDDVDFAIQQAKARKERTK